MIYSWPVFQYILSSLYKIIYTKFWSTYENKDKFKDKFWSTYEKYKCYLLVHMYFTYSQFKIPGYTFLCYFKFMTMEDNKTV